MKIAVYDSKPETMNWSCKKAVLWIYQAFIEERTKYWRKIISLSASVALI